MPSNKTEVKKLYDGRLAKIGLRLSVFGLIAYINFYFQISNLGLLIFFTSLLLLRPRNEIFLAMLRNFALASFLRYFFLITPLHLCYHVAFTALVLLLFYIIKPYLPETVCKFFSFRYARLIQLRISRFTYFGLSQYLYIIVLIGSYLRFFPLEVLSCAHNQVVSSFDYYTYTSDTRDLLITRHRAMSKSLALLKYFIMKIEYENPHDLLDLIELEKRKQLKLEISTNFMSNKSIKSTRDIDMLFRKQEDQFKLINKTSLELYKHFKAPDFERDLETTRKSFHRVTNLFDYVQVNEKISFKVKFFKKLVWFEGEIKNFVSSFFGYAPKLTFSSDFKRNTEHQILINNLTIENFSKKMNHVAIKASLGLPPDEFIGKFLNEFTYNYGKFLSKNTIAITDLERKRKFLINPITDFERKSKLFVTHDSDLARKRTGGTLLSDMEYKKLMFKFNSDALYHDNLKTVVKFDLINNKSFTENPAINYSEYFLSARKRFNARLALETKLLTITKSTVARIPEYQLMGISKRLLDMLAKTEISEKFLESKKLPFTRRIRAKQASAFHDLASLSRQIFDQVNPKYSKNVGLLEMKKDYQKIKPVILQDFITVIQEKKDQK